MSIKNRAEKRIEIAINKLIYLLDVSDDRLAYQINEALEKLRSIESDIMNAKVKDGQLITH
jgi:hypothetical protein